MMKRYSLNINELFYVKNIHKKYNIEFNLFLRKLIGLQVSQQSFEYSRRVIFFLKKN